MSERNIKDVSPQQYLINLFKRKKLNGDIVGKGVIYNLIDIIDTVENEDKEPKKALKNSEKLNELTQYLTKNELNTFYNYLALEQYLKSNYDIHSGYAQQFDNGYSRIITMYDNILKSTVAKFLLGIIPENDENKEIAAKVVDQYFNADLETYFADNNDVLDADRHYALNLIIPAVKYITIFNTILQLISEKLEISSLYEILHIDLPFPTEEEKGLFDDSIEKIINFYKKIGWVDNKEYIFTMLSYLKTAITAKTFMPKEETLAVIRNYLEIDDKNFGNINIGLLQKAYVDLMEDLD